MEPSSEILIQNTWDGTWEPEFLSSTPVVGGRWFTNYNREDCS